MIRQQCLPFTVCAAGCRTAEEQRDDEVRTSQVPEQSEGKTKMMKQQYLPFTVLKHSFGNIGNISIASWLQQHTVCAEGCETAEEQSDDEVHTSQVPEQSEGKTKGSSNSTCRLRYALKGARQQRSKATMRSAYLKYLRKAKVKQR